MAIEIEAKMRITDRDALENKLAELGAIRRGVTLESNTFFDTPSAELKSADQGLRVRVSHDAAGHTTVMLTHKGPRAHGGLKSRVEHETTIGDAMAIADVLQALGYHPTFTFQKVRRSWVLDGCHVDIDLLPNLGAYVEIEGPNEEKVLAARDKLGLKGVPLIRASYIAMLIADARERGLPSDIIEFPEVPKLD